MGANAPHVWFHLFTGRQLEPALPLCKPVKRPQRRNQGHFMHGGENEHSYLDDNYNFYSFQNAQLDVPEMPEHACWAAIALHELPQLTFTLFANPGFTLRPIIRMFSFDMFYPARC